MMNPNCVCYNDSLIVLYVLVFFILVNRLKGAIARASLGTHLNESRCVIDCTTHEAQIFINLIN